ncbi:hypothetical protein Tco_0901796 [Tanacetum coccineum]
MYHHVMEKVINTYKVGFVINISELGEDDPLSQNATQYFGSSKAPWYTTIARKGEESDYFIKKVNISSGRTLDIIALNTEKIQDAYISGQPCANEARVGGPHLTPISQGSYPTKGMANLFLLHRVSPLNMTLLPLSINVHAEWGALSPLLQKTWCEIPPAAYEPDDIRNQSATEEQVRGIFLSRGAKRT